VGSKNLWNVGKLLLDCTAQQPVHTSRSKNLKSHEIRSTVLWFCSCDVQKNNRLTKTNLHLTWIWQA
jgi:hypothetical protein